MSLFIYLQTSNLKRSLLVKMSLVTCSIVFISFFMSCLQLWSKERQTSMVGSLKLGQACEELDFSKGPSGRRPALFEGLLHRGPQSKTKKLPPFFQNIQKSAKKTLIEAIEPKTPGRNPRDETNLQETL